MPSVATTDFILGSTGMVFDYAGSVAPNGFLLCYGQAVSRATYAALFAVIGTAYGVGDGSTTFNVPDLRGLVVAGVGNMGGTASGRMGVTTTGTTTAGSAVVTAIPSTANLAVGMQAIGGAIPAGVTIASIDSATQVTLSTGTGVTAATAGAIRFCVLDSHTLGATGGTATYALATAHMPSHSHSYTRIPTVGQTNGSAAFGISYDGIASTAGYATNYTSGMNNTGGGQAHPIVQPTVVLNKIIKI